jgi:hypothetical protein
LKSLVISRTRGRYHNWQLIASELGHELNNKQCCQRWKCIKHRYNKKRHISDISGNESTIDNDEDRSTVGHQFPVVDETDDEMNHQSVNAGEAPVAMIAGQQHNNRNNDVNVEKAFLNQKRKKEPHEIRTKWTPAMVRDQIE